jgi:hypothetical protein
VASGGTAWSAPALAYLDAGSTTPQ